MRRILPVLLLLAACQSSRHGESAPAMVLPALSGRTVLGAGVYETGGVKFPVDGVLVGAGMDKTVIRLTGPARTVLDGWSAGGGGSARISDLTIDCGAMVTDTNGARCGIGGYRWKDAVIERVKVVGLGSFTAPGHVYSESFGIILSQSTNCVVRDCVVERNNGGYVSAYCLSGLDVVGSNLVARFRFDGDWVRLMGEYAGVLQAFTVGGGSKPGGSKDLAYVNCRVEGASRAVYGDTGFRVDGLRLGGITGTIKSYPLVPGRGVVLVGEPEYLNVRTNVEVRR